jgi:Immunity protein 53
MNQGILEWIQKYYQSLCDGDWEHSYGFKIDNIDNPGWVIRFDLEETSMENVEFTQVRIERSEYDWLVCSVENNVFKGQGGPLNLVEMLVLFRNWVESRRST